MVPVLKDTLKDEAGSCSVFLFPHLSVSASLTSKYVFTVSVVDRVRYR